MSKLSQQALLTLFAKQNNWQDRYRQLILLSKQLPEFAEAQKIDANLVNGCENRVWVTHQQSEDNRFDFQGESEGRIVKGLLTILFVIANGKTAEQIKQLDFDAILKTMKVTDELSESRLVGLAKLIERIKSVC